MTPEQIAELRAALAKATPGPWRTFAGVNDDGVWAACGPEHAADYDADETNEPGDVAEQAAQRDAELIALMRNALPSLIAAAERCGEAQATLDTIAHMVDAVHDQSTGPSYPGTDDEVMSAIATLRADLARVTAERDVWLRTAQELARDAEVLAESVRQFVVEDEFNPGRPEAKVKLRAMRGTLSEYRRKMSASYFDAIERGDHAKGGG